MTDRARRRPRAALRAGDAGGTVGVPRRRRPIAFGLHQFFEYILAPALVVLSVHIAHSSLLLAGGVIFGVLALTARGPLGLVRVCGPRLHAALDIAAGVLLALAPLLGPLRPGVGGIVAIEIVALAWLRVAMLTRYPVRVRGDSAPARIGPTVASSSPQGGGSTAGDEPPAAALAAIQGLRRLTLEAKRRWPEPQSTFDTGARRMGRHAGRVQRAWRRRGR